MNHLYNSIHVLHPSIFPRKAMYTIVLLILLSLLPLFLYLKTTAPKMNGTLRLPPGPRGLPIIGSLHLVGSLPNRGLHRLSKTYGPVMYLKLGLVPTVIISSPEMAEHVLKTHDHCFSNRQPSEFGRLYGSKGFAFVDYGPYWRGARKLAVSQVLSSGKVMSFASIMEEEVHLFMENLKEFTIDGAPLVNIKKKAASMLGNVMCRVVLGRRCVEERINGDSSFGEICREITGLLGHFNVNDFLPFIGWLDVHGVRRRGKVVMELVRGFLEKIIDEHVVDDNDQGSDQSSGKDFVDFLLSVMDDKEGEWTSGFDFDRSHIMSILMDAIVGATDTLPCGLEWALTEIVRNPAVMVKLREELARVIGNEWRVIKLTDLGELKYLAMVVKESMRLHPVGPLLAHRSTEECAIGGGLYIPKDCNVLVNVWAIVRDSQVWENAEEFMPERFENSEVDVRGSDFRVLPFGSGRRACPGMNFSLTMIPLVLANLLHSFDWELPEGVSPSMLDMQEKYEGLAMTRVHPLVLKPVLKA